MKLNKQGIIVLFVGVLLSPNLYAQQFINAFSPDYSTPKGSTSAIALDESGLLWIARSSEIVAFDGLRIVKKIPIPNQPSDIVPSGEHLVVGCLDGKIYVASHHQVGVSLEIASPSISPVKDLLAWNKGVLIAWEDGVLGYLDFNNVLDIELIEVNTSLGELYALAATNDGFVVGSDYGLSVYDSLRKPIIQLAVGIVTALNCQDSTLLVATYNSGVDYYSIPNFKKVKTLPLNLVNLKELVAYQDDLYTLRDDDLFKFSYSSNLQPVDSAFRIKDMELLPNGLLIALQDNGALRSYDLNFRKLATSTKTDLTCVATGDMMAFWTDGNEIGMTDLRTNRDSVIFNIPHHSRVVAMDYFHGKVVVGTFNAGLFAIDPRNGNVSQWNSLSQGLDDNNVIGLSQNADTLWIVTLSGISFMEAGGKISRLEGNKPWGSTFVYDALACNSSLVVGTDGAGFFARDGQTFRLITNSDSAAVFYHLADQNNDVWCLEQQGRIFKYTRESDLLERVYPQFEINGFGSFAATNSHGLLLHDEQLTLFGPSGYRNFGGYKGFEQLSGSSLHQVTATAGQSFIFSNGPYLYELDPLVQINFPSTLLNLFQVNDQPVELSLNTLSHNENNVIFELCTPWYADPEQITYQVQLVGFDEVVTTSTSPTLVYPNLASGNYRLEVSVLYQGLPMAAKQVLAEFKILKPIYLRSWFILLMLTLCALIAYVLIRMRIRYITRLDVLRRQKAESELATLRSQVDPHFLFNSFNTLLHVVEHEPNLAPAYVEKLSDFYRNLIDTKTEHWNSVADELKMTSDYIFLLKKRFGEALVVETHVDQQMLNLKLPALSLQLLIENAVKHNSLTRSMPLQIRIFIESGYLVVSNDYRPKSKSNHRPGLGLENISRRFEMLAGKKIIITKDADLFIVKLPLSKW